MDFAEVYKKLNKAQKKAVDTIEGPLLVLAGPGTGKTQLLSARVANILTITDSRPENILCLTFTEKAANNMKQRLLDMIGPSARKVVIKTFHGLGAEIMNSNPDCFWNAARLEAAPEAVKLEVVSEILSTLPLHNPLALKFSGQYTLVGDVLSAIGKAKEAGLTPEKLKAITNANLSYLDSIDHMIHPLVDDRLSVKQIQDYRALVDALPESTHDATTAPLPSAAKVLKESLIAAVSEAESINKSSPLSEWKRNWIENVGGKKFFKDVRRNQWWCELADVYQQYQKQMHKNRYFDFADMILEVITQLEQNETLRADLQERFNYILIDEFQDTNDAQFRLSYLIANNPAANNRPNIMAVGDDDQAIYRFQGANLSNARQFLESYKDTELIVLTENYRSHQSILDVAQIVAQQIEHRLIDDFSQLSKDIEAKREIKKGITEHRQFPSQTEQYCQIAAEVAGIREKEKTTTAVLARKHDSLERIAAELNKRGVPIRYERSSNILEHPLVILITELAKLLGSIHSGNRELTNSLLSEVLAHPAWEIPATTLWRTALNQDKKANWLDMMLDSEDEKLPKIATWLIELAKLSRSQPLQVTIEHLLGLRTLQDFTSPIKSYFLSQELSSDYIFSLTALQRLRSLAAEYAKKENAGVDEFVHYIKINQEHHVVLANEAAVITGEKPVELMTVHKAKGLEFDTVYVVDIIEKQWQPSKRGRTPPSNLESLQSYGEDSDDYARLLFVALTRAEKNLIVSSYQFDEHGAEVLPSPFIHHMPISLQQPSGSEIEIAETTIMWPVLKNEEMKSLLSSMLESYQLSATGLIDFLDVPSGGPNNFLRRHVLRLPDVQNASLSYGSAIHTGLETAQRLVNGTGLDLQKVLESFEADLRQKLLDESEFERYKAHGRTLLTRLIENQLVTFTAGSFPERRLNNVSVGESYIEGVLDLVQVTENTVSIIDYKTGQALSSLTTTSKSEGIRAWKHRLQLTYYVLLAKESGLARQGQNVSAEMVYVESENPNKMRLAFTPTEEELERLKNIIVVVCSHLRKVEFPNVQAYSKDLDGIHAFEEDLLKMYNKK